MRHGLDDAVGAVGIEPFDTVQDQAQAQEGVQHCDAQALMLQVMQGDGELPGVAVEAQQVAMGLQQAQQHGLLASR